jgi:hypothetical protein
MRVLRNKLSSFVHSHWLLHCYPLEKYITENRGTLFYPRERVCVCERERERERERKRERERERERKRERERE